jgi:cellulose synthase/poly-beta-1,6-N-acetylglucosamine synthase-like glycosyltransferase
MSFIDNTKKKILDNSDMYNYYKEGYVEYKSKYEELLKEKTNIKSVDNEGLCSKMEDLYSQQAELEKNIQEIENQYSSNFGDLVFKLKKMNIKPEELEDLLGKLDDFDKLNRELNIKNNQLRRYRIPFNDFDEYLISSYTFPFIRPPFSEQDKRILSVMEDVANYLIKVVEESPEHPLISVIMPVYNRKDVVMNAIDSVLAQTYDNFELIVIDDASTDGTTELLKEIDHEKVRVIFHEKNKYASGARNTGLKNSKGEYVAYLDSDNLLDERYLAATVGAFLLLPDADALHSAQYRYETYDSKPFLVQFGALNKSLLHNHNFVDMNCFAHKRYIYDEVGGFDETLKGADDWELILKINTHYTVYSVPFLLSKCYLGIVDNRVTDLVPTDTDKIRRQNEVLTKVDYELKKDIDIIIPLENSVGELKRTVQSIIDLNHEKIKIIISADNQIIDLENYLGDLINQVPIQIIKSDYDYGFTHLINNAIVCTDENADVLLLSKNAILTVGSLEALQKYSYELSDCGLAVSQQVLENGSIIKKHVPYAHEDYWCDITPSKYHKNIKKVPLFHKGKVLELNMAPFFCTYIKRDVLNKSCGFNLQLGKHYHSIRLFSEFIRNILDLKIYHISDAVVINNISEEYRNSKPTNNDYNYTIKENNWDNCSNDLDYKKYIWDF